MKKLADFLVDHRVLISAVMLILTIVCCVIALKIPVNRDRTVYLADTSNMKHGLDIMKTEFPDEPDKSSIRVMFDDLTEEQIPEIKARLEAIPDVSSVSYDAESEDYNKENHTLFVVNSGFDYSTDEEKQIEEAIKNGFSGYNMAFRNNDIQSTMVPLWLLIIALALMSVILLVMCKSWLEPLLFLITVGIAVAINMGTNFVFPYVNETTASVGPIIQLVLSMDYSIILMNRYRQEKNLHSDRKDAMKAAISGSASSIASSSLTTAVGLLALLFLSFKLGPELGIVLAKGVVISMICVFTVLPVMILRFDKQLEKTEKKSPRIPVGGLAKFSCKARFAMPVIFIILFVGFYFLQGLTDITFMEKSEDPLADIFRKENQVVLIYHNDDEEHIGKIVSGLEADERITEITGYFNTLGKEFSAEEMSEVINTLGSDIQIDANMMSMLYYLASSGEIPDFPGMELISIDQIYMLFTLQNLGTNSSDVKMTIPQLFDFLCNKLMADERFANYFDDETKASIQSSKGMLNDAAAQLKGKTYSRLVITSDYEEESPETLSYIAKLNELCDENLGEYYLIGSSVMVSEMDATFGDEYLMITIITAIAIFLVVLIAFRNPMVPLILTLLVQCGVFITVYIIGAYSGSIVYLPLLIVQSILMGATIDYGIVFCNFYRETRKALSMEDALKKSYENSMHTIMTSGSILVLVLASLGFFTDSAMISEVSLTLSIGVFIAILLILFIMPGLVACCDRLICRSKKQ